MWVGMTEMGRLVTLRLPGLVAGGGVACAGGPEKGGGPGLNADGHRCR